MPLYCIHPELTIFGFTTLELYLYITRLHFGEVCTIKETYKLAQAFWPVVKYTQIVDVLGMNKNDKSMQLRSAQ